VQIFLAAQSQKYSRSTLRGMRIAMGRVLTWAVDCNWLEKNPCSKIPLPHSNKVARQRVILSVEDVKAIAHGLNEPYATLVLFLAVTGVRVGEAIGIKWTDFDGDSLRISRTVYEGKEGTPKSKSSNRQLPIPPELVKRMNALDKQGEYIFHSHAGTAINAGNVLKRYLHPAANRCGIQLSGWHDFRHTVATHMLRDGSSPKVVSGILGHADVGITLEVYEHTDATGFREPLNRLASQLLPPVTKPASPIEVSA
jgi:integrase